MLSLAMIGEWCARIALQHHTIAIFFVQSAKDRESSEEEKKRRKS